VKEERSDVAPYPNCSVESAGHRDTCAVVSGDWRPALHLEPR